ncbi:hypothetical protein TIFTF001_008807 [Ficus carica]|uniref:Uncharacterized protein n=1 Tax=Ficus carica TaxID=3494 RepID=A0AA88CYD7_FICCA|nr:hypothetical protein TIFTF001_008807 [Ficus carica]
MRKWKQNVRRKKHKPTSKATTKIGRFIIPSNCQWVGMGSQYHTGFISFTALARSSSVRYAGTTVTGADELLNDISRNGAISAGCAALVYQIPRTSTRSHQSRMQKNFGRGYKSDKGTINGGSILKKNMKTKRVHCRGFTDCAEDRDKLLSLIICVNGCSLKTSENLDVVKYIPIERLMIEADSPYCEIKNTHAGIKLVKSVWPSKKKEKYDQDSIVRGHNEPCLVRLVLEVVAGCKGISDIEQLSRTIYHNICRVFFRQDPDSAADALLSSGHGPQ